MQKYAKETGRGLRAGERLSNPLGEAVASDTAERMKPGPVSDPRIIETDEITCAYSFEDARSVVHGRMVPVDSAGGRLLPLPSRTAP